MVDDLWALPVRHFPEWVEIDEADPRSFVQRYPPDWTPERIQSFLGRERQVEPGEGPE